MSIASQPVSIEKRYLRPDGEVVWAFCRGIVVHDDDGEPSYIVTHFVDFTARKLAERREATPSCASSAPSPTRRSAWRSSTSTAPS